jgi:uncharacterized protein (TIGR00290 family)
VREKVVVSWSGGKDAALALAEARRTAEVVGLFTTVTAEDGRVGMHGVPGDLVRRQAEALGLPWTPVAVPAACPNAVYEAAVRAALSRFREAGVTGVVCGDLFLEDVRRYREERLFGDGLRGVFPLWGVGTGELARRFLASGFRAVLCCVDTRVLDESFAGRWYDGRLLEDLPEGVDPCGENGEFHTFVCDGPGFARPVAVTAGGRRHDGRFARCELLPSS